MDYPTEIGRCEKRIAELQAFLGDGAATANERGLAQELIAQRTITLKTFLLLKDMPAEMQKTFAAGFDCASAAFSKPSSN